MERHLLPLRAALTLALSIGNVLTDEPGAAWRSPRAQEIRTASRTCPRLCRMLNCNL